MSHHIFLGFGFGAIQGGLFLYEAHRTGQFDRLIVAEVVPEIVRALRANQGAYRLNVATARGVARQTIRGVEVYNPNDPADREALVAAVAQATELGTALPSIDFFDRGAASVAGILAEGFTRRLQQPAPVPGVLYTAENHHNAAEALEAAVTARLGESEAARWREQFQIVNTVLGKMSRVVTEPGEIAAEDLAPVAPGLERALLVEEFNRILINRVRVPGLARALTVFEEKGDLLPFEEAKLYGHNATHALIGYLAAQRGYRFMFEAGQDAELMGVARKAFVGESGAGIIARHRQVDPLFTPEGYRAYVDDLLVRMVNPYLRDSVERVTRDPRRKLMWDDRLVGVMRLALEAGVTPARFARGARAALDLALASEPGQTAAGLLDDLWLSVPATEAARKAELKQLILA